MANTYLLLIDQLYIQPVQTPNPDEDGTEILDVITKIDYNYEATSPIGNIRKYHCTKIMPSPTTAEGYLEYKDVTYEIAQSWVKNSEEDVEIIYRLLDTQIEEQEKVIQNINLIKAETKKLEAIYTQKLADLEEMKKSVLQKAFSGQLNTIN